MSDENWPKRPDGSNKRVGEMTLDEKRRVFTNACNALKPEFEDPNGALARLIRGDLHS